MGTGGGAIASGGATGSGGAIASGGATGSGGTGGSGTGGLVAGSGGMAGAGSGGTSAAGGLGGSEMSVVDGGSADSAGADAGIPESAACMPAAGTGPLASTEVFCAGLGTMLGVPNGAACTGTTHVLPSPLVVGVDNAVSFISSYAGPFNLELWGSNTACKAEELLWWVPLSVGTHCAQFRPSKPYTHVLFVYRRMTSPGFFVYARSTLTCPGGTCSMGTTGTGKLSDTPLTAPIGDYELGRYDGLYDVLDMDLGHSGRATVSWTGTPRVKVGEAQPLSAGVFRMPATDPFGDAWYCTGEGSTLTQMRLSTMESYRFSMRGVTRLGDCAPDGTSSISASLYPTQPNSGSFVADIAGTISSWNGTNAFADYRCHSSICNMRFRNAGQEHAVHVKTMLSDITLGTMGPTPVTAATWLVQPTATQPFAMACSSEGTLDYTLLAPSTLQLAKVSTPRSCPGTPIANDHVDFTVATIAR
jgi:hypothetical protein